MSENKELTASEDQQAIYDQLDLSEAARKAILTAKEAGYEPVFTKISGKEFVYKPVTRKQWRELRTRMSEAASKIDQDDDLAAAELREEELERLVRMCEVYYENSENLYAGTVDSLSDSILLSSGFGGAEVDPIRL